MSYKNIEHFIVKNKSGKINYKASIAKYEKQLKQFVSPVSDKEILKVINKIFDKNKGRSIRRLADFVIMQLNTTPQNQKYVRICVTKCLKNNTGAGLLLNHKKNGGYTRWSDI